ncbi:MAG: glycerol-3-phosphate 1-O-acyltransferase PlsY [Armatimonadetes bacterium]|nr:glycerol-3-phosphate 1-O-acyltransferase PlsY [Armatimonadota bacterium]
MQALSAIVLVCLGYLAGSIPFGYLLVKAIRGLDVRDYGSHNIGMTNVARVAGWQVAGTCLLLDMAKGVLPVWVAARAGSGAWVVVGAAGAACAGHAYSLFFLLKERRFSRGKAVATGLGVMLGFTLIGALPPWIPLAALVVWEGMRRACRYASPASLAAAATVAALVWVPPIEAPYRYFAGLLFLFIVWKHKENIGRLLDGTEVKIGEKVPLAGIDADEVACAFIIHPFSPEGLWQSRRFRWLAGWMPPRTIRVLNRFIRPMKNDVITGITTRDGRRARVYLIGVPLMPDQIKSEEALAVKRAVQGARLARQLGASVVGLGAFMSVVGEKGAAVQRQSPIPVTNGGSLTAGSVRLGLAALADRIGDQLRQATVAVVGANGVVGFKICRDLAPVMQRLLMIGTNAERLAGGARLLRKSNPLLEIETAVGCDRLAGADIVFAATSDPNPVIFSRHLKKGALVFDLGRPADVDVSVLTERPDVRVIPGGTIRLPGEDVRQRLDLGFGPGNVPACLAETIIIALERAYDRVTLGDGTSAENVEYFVGKAEELGFAVVAEPYGSPVSIQSPGERARSGRAGR